MLRVKSILAGLVILTVVGFVLRVSLESADLAAAEQPIADLTVVIRTARNLSEPGDIPALVQRLIRGGVREAWVQFKQDEPDEVPGGVVFYPSDFAPVAPAYEDDRLDRFVDLLHAAGIRVCAWVPSFNDQSAASAHVDWRAHTITEDGSVIEQEHWLCPRSSEAVEYQARILSEVVTRYPDLAAVYTDFIRFDDDFSCVCHRCMSAFRAAMADEGLTARIEPMDLRKAASERSELWSAWTDFRSQAICDAVEAFRDRIDAAREDMWFGACVLPFSARDYSFNTQSGQDFYEMARVGLDELMLMGYWDDWDKSPAWLKECVVSAEQLVDGECRLGVLLDGDMAVRRTWLTLDALRDSRPEHCGYFNYGQWSPGVLERVALVDRAARAETAPRPAFTAVSIRIDTEPDHERRYDTVDASMIDRLVSMFKEESVKATFVTCGKLVEHAGHAEALREAARQGHEIACHAYDHEQLDSLAPEDERLAIAQGFDALEKAGLHVTGFGAPRNSITWSGRDALMERGVAYDGSAAYDPVVSFLDAEFAWHSSGDGRRIVVVPFIMPNDWDGLYVMQVDPERLLEMWRDRLDAVTSSGEAVFVLDVHQWIAARPEMLEVLRAFLREVKSRGDCRLMRLDGTAAHACEHVADVEARARQNGYVGSNPAPGNAPPS